MQVLLHNWWHFHEASFESMAHTMRLFRPIGEWGKDPM
jgi:hypothetical protein